MAVFPMRLRIDSGGYIFLAVLLLTVPLRWILAAFGAAIFLWLALIPLLRRRK